MREFLLLEVYRPRFEYMDGRVCLSASVLFLSSVDLSSFLIAAKCDMSHPLEMVEGEKEMKLGSCRRGRRILLVCN
jgi:hypothetical protein